jgi:hypothetical protein
MLATPSNTTADSQRKLRPNTVAYWIFLPGLLASTYVLWEMLSQPWRRSVEIALTLLFFFPSLVGVICRALGQRVASFVCGMAVVGLYWTATFFLLFLYTRESVVGLIWVANLFLPAVFVALATTASLNKRLGPSWGLGAVGIGLLCGAIGAGAVVASKEAAWNYPKPLDPTILRLNMITIDKCSQEFARSNPEKGFPESLQQLGHQGSGCIPEALLGDRAKGFTISYDPGPKDAKGKISSYKVTGRESSPQGKESSSIFTDESGLIHIRFDGPHGKGATSESSSDSMSLQDVVSCVSGNSRHSEFRHPNSNITHSDRDQAIRDCVLLNPYLNRSLTGNRKFSIGGYDFEYGLVPGENGMISGFTVRGSPRPYGVAGVRSYLAVGTIDESSDTLCVYATPEDRPATIKDPLAKASEVGLSGIGPIATYGKGAIH